MSAALPVVGVLACRKTRANGTTYSRVNDLVTAALIDYAGVAAVLLHTERPAHAAAVLERLDGLVLPGTGSFVRPELSGRGAEAAVEGREYDPERDATALALLEAADALPDLPVLASCRGMQELAVHCGGTLAPVVESYVDHRPQAGPDFPDRWAPAHAVAIRPGGVLAGLTGAGAAFTVNSQHSERVAKLPEEARIEAVAPDGVIEALSLGAPERFAVGFQWHFERGTAASDLDRTLLAAFGEHCRTRAERHRR